MPLWFFFDAMGGIVWELIGTSTLLKGEGKQREVIGSVNIAAFFVSLKQVILFFSMLRLMPWPIILGLIIGGVMVAYLTARLLSKTLFLIIRLFIMLLQVRCFQSLIGVSIF